MKSKAMEIFFISVFAGGLIYFSCFFVWGRLFGEVSLLLAVSLHIAATAAVLRYYAAEDKKEILEEIRKSRGE